MSVHAKKGIVARLPFRRMLVRTVLVAVRRRKPTIHGIKTYPPPAIAAPDLVPFSKGADTWRPTLAAVDDWIPERRRPVPCLLIDFSQSQQPRRRRNPRHSGNSNADD